MINSERSRNVGLASINDAKETKGVWLLQVANRPSFLEGQSHVILTDDQRLVNWFHRR